MNNDELKLMQRAGAARVGEEEAMANSEGDPGVDQQDDSDAAYEDAPTTGATRLGPSEPLKEVRPERVQNKEAAQQRISGGVNKREPGRVKRTGQVVERPQGGQSKQSRTGPVLKTIDGLVKVYVLGDNPFSPSQLSMWLGQRVEVAGVWRGETLRVAPDDIRLVTGVSGASNDASLMEHGSENHDAAPTSKDQETAS